MSKVKMRMTVIFEYEADSENYGTEDIKKMIEIDQRNFLEDPALMIDSMKIDSFKIKAVD